MRYKLLAREFDLSRFKQCSGAVVASKDAFFFVIDPTAIKRGGTPLVSILSSAMSRSAQNAKSSYAMELSDLPKETTSDADWPIEIADGRVFVIPRDAVRNLKYPWWGEIRVATDEHRFDAKPHIWQRKSNYEFLTENDWHF